MSRFIELLQAAIRREIQWEDTRTEGVDDDLPFAPPRVPEPQGYVATVPMQLGKH